MQICQRLYGKGQLPQKYREWRIERIRKILLTAVCGITFALILMITDLWADKSVADLARPDAAEGSRLYSLTARLGQEPLGEILVEVPARKLPQEACDLLLEEAAMNLEGVILGKNEALDQIRQNLSLPDTLCEGLVEVVWESSNFEVVDSRGNVNNENLQEACVVTLTARLTCQQRQRSISFPIIVQQPGRDQAARLSREVARMLSEEGQEEKEQEWFSLPDSFEDLPLSWSVQTKPYGIWVLILTAVGCVGIYGAAYQELQKEEQRRQQSLLYDYPGFLARLTMLAGTGMPVRVVFGRLAADRTENARPVYEEVWRTCREMESGITQKEAFENFGRRCRLAPYKKCAALLTQNLSRGADGMLEALWQEAEHACEERRALARQKGEEAQTKLLFPMMMMLLVVMVLIMVPACFSFAGM